MNTEDKIRVMRAFADGKTVQWRPISHEVWITLVHDDPEWNWAHCEYRIAPVKKYRWMIACRIHGDIQGCITLEYYETEAEMHRKLAPYIAAAFIEAHKIESTGKDWA
jgi:hypothetical protein